MPHLKEIFSQSFSTTVRGGDDDDEDIGGDDEEIGGDDEEIGKDDENIGGNDDDEPRVGATIGGLREVGLFPKDIFTFCKKKKKINAPQYKKSPN